MVYRREAFGARVMGGALHVSSSPGRSVVAETGVTATKGRGETQHNSGRNDVAHPTITNGRGEAEGRGSRVEDLKGEQTEEGGVG
jgi:hypothetical protein